MFIRLLALISCITPCCCACTFPGDLIGEWYSTSFGTLTFTSTSFSGFTSSITTQTLTFTCHVVEGTQYVVKSNHELFLGVTVETYLCMNLEQVSTVTYVYTLDTNIDAASGVRQYSVYVGSTTSSVTLSDVCTYNDTRSPGEYELLILKANISDAAVSCPSHFLTVFNVSMTTRSTTDCEASVLDGLTSTSLVFNYSSCANGTFNAAGHLSCLYNKYSDYGYLTTYNNDTSVDGTNTYRFTCWVYAKNADVLNATEYPGACQTSQTPSTVPSPGISYYMIDQHYSPADSDEGTNITTIVVISIIAGILLIIVVVAVVAFVCHTCKKPPAQEPDPKIRKKRVKMARNEYTPRRSISREDTAAISKQTMDEIINGMPEKKKTPLLNGAPTTRETWRKKWETDLRPTTPLSVRMERMKRSKEHFQSTSGISQISGSAVRDDKRLKTSSSVPEGLDHNAEVLAFWNIYPPKTDLDMREQSASTNSPGSPRKFSEPHDRSTSTPRYSERAHASATLPESTGKFGASNKQGSLTSFNFAAIDPKLGIIRENPLSRDNTAFLAEKATKRPLDEELSVFSHSTATAGEVQLATSLNTTRYTHLSASSASIFDDPSWLGENSNHSDRAFRTSKHLFSDMPTRDSTWFMKSRKKAEISREDLDYFRNRMSRTRYVVGLQNTGHSHTWSRNRSSSALQIIEDELNNRSNSKKRKKTKPKIDWQYKWEHQMRPVSAPPTVYKRRRTSYLSQTSTTTIGNDTNTANETDTVAETSRSTRDIAAIDANTTKTAGETGAKGYTTTVNMSEEHNRSRSILVKMGHSQDKLDAVSKSNTEDIETDAISERSHVRFEFDPADDISGQDNAMSRSGDMSRDVSVEDDWSFDNVSLQSSIFYPEDWLFREEEDIEACWTKGATLFLPPKPKLRTSNRKLSLTKRL